MTLIAGILNRHRNPLPSGVVDRIRRSISRCADDQLSVFEDEHSFLAKLDIGAFAERAELADMRGNVTLLTGEPLIRESGREQDAEAIHGAFLQGDASILANADGVFSVAHADSPSSSDRNRV